MALSTWITIVAMNERAFTGAHRRYHPKRNIATRTEAVIAKAFDLLPIVFDHPRRALCCAAKH